MGGVKVNKVNEVNKVNKVNPKFCRCEDLFFLPQVGFVSIKPVLRQVVDVTC